MLGLGLGLGLGLRLGLGLEKSSPPAPPRFSQNEPPYTTGKPLQKRFSHFTDPTLRSKTFPKSA